MRLGFVVVCLVVFVGCSGWLVREQEQSVGETIDPGPAYEQLFGRYVELCALSQYRSFEHGEGGVPGHAVMYLKGACKDESAPTPELRPCKTVATSVDDPEHGAGVSVNRWLQNANWVATPSHRLFFQGALEEGDAVTRETFDRTVHAVIEAGVFNGVVFLPDMPTQGSLEEVVGAEFVGTDFALRMARTAYCARLPVTDEMMGDIIDYLNAVNRAYASGRANYNWSGYSDNCAHLLHNALAAASIWRPRSVQTSKLRQIGNLSVPANEVIDLAKLGTEGPLTDGREVYRNDEARDALLNLDWLPRRHGAVMTLAAGLGAQRALRHARAHHVAPGPLPPRGDSYRQAHLRRSPLHAAASEPGVIPWDLRRDARGARRTHRRRLAAAAERPLPANRRSSTTDTSRSSSPRSSGCWPSWTPGTRRRRRPRRRRPNHGTPPVAPRARRCRPRQRLRLGRGPAARDRGLDAACRDGFLPPRPDRRAPATARRPSPSP